MICLPFPFFQVQGSAPAIMVSSFPTPCSHPRVLGGGLHPWLPKSAHMRFQSEAHSEPAQCWGMGFSHQVCKVFSHEIGQWRWGHARVTGDAASYAAALKGSPPEDGAQPHGWQRQRWWGRVLVTSFDHKSTGTWGWVKPCLFISRSQ